MLMDKLRPCPKCILPCPLHLSLQWLYKRYLLWSQCRSRGQPCPSPFWYANELLAVHTKTCLLRCTTSVCVYLDYFPRPLWNPAVFVNSSDAVCLGDACVPVRTAPLMISSIPFMHYNRLDLNLSPSPLFSLHCWVFNPSILPPPPLPLPDTISWIWEKFHLILWEMTTNFNFIIIIPLFPLPTCLMSQSIAHKSCFFYLLASLYVLVPVVVFAYMRWLWFLCMTLVSLLAC